MYLDHFGLKVTPFGLSPKLNFLFNSGAFEESMAHLLYGLENDEAIIMITGPIGSGKTMATHSFMNGLGDNYLFALVTNTRINSRELLKLILDDLNVEYSSDSDKSDLLILFKEFLLKQGQDGKKVILVIDEAQNLSSDSLEEIRLLTNFGQGETQPVTVIMVGQPELKENISKPELEQLRQRIRVHYHLEPLSSDELKNYIHHRMAVAGCSAKIFTDEAFDKMYKLSGGVPRIVNTLGDAALLSAYVAERHEVIGEDIQLPEINAQVSIGTDSTKKIGLTSNEPKKRNGLVVWFFLIIVLAGAGYLFRDSIFSLVDRVLEANENQDVVEPLPSGRNNLSGENKPDLIIQNAHVDSTTLENSVLPVDVGNVVEVINETPMVLVNYFIHISSFLTKERADTYSNRLKEDANSFIVKEMEVNGKLWYRIYLGPFESRENALARAQILEREGMISYYQISEIAIDE